MRITLENDTGTIIYDRDFYLLPGDTLSVRVNVPPDIEDHHVWEMTATGLLKRSRDVKEPTTIQGDKEQPAKSLPAV